MRTPTDIVILIERLARVLHSEAHADGLKPTQWEALRYLSRANRFSRTPSALTAYLGMTKGTVSQTLNALERKGLIEKSTDAADKRQVSVALTRAGGRRLKNDPVALILKSASKLSVGERESLAKTLEFLLKDMLRQREGRAFGACKTCRYFEKNAKGGAPHRCGLLEVALSPADSTHICVEHEEAA